MGSKIFRLCINIRLVAALPVVAVFDGRIRSEKYAQSRKKVNGQIPENKIFICHSTHPMYVLMYV